MITTTTQRNLYAGDGATVAFVPTWPVTDDDDFKVYLLVDSTGVQAEQDKTTHYTVVATNADYANGFTVTMVTAPASGETLVIVRKMPKTQSTDLIPSGNFAAQDVEDALDRIWMAIQDLENNQARCIKVPESDDLTLDLVLPDSSQRLSHYLKTTATGAITTAAS